LTFKVTDDGKFVKRAFTPAEALALLEADGAKFVDLQFTDVPGRLRHVTLPTEMMEEGMFSEGVAKLDGSSVRGFVDIHESDMLLVPDADTYGVIPWSEGELKTARFICDVRAGYGRGRFSRDPRHVAQIAEAKIREAGFTDSLWGPRSSSSSSTASPGKRTTPSGLPSRSRRRRPRPSPGGPTSRSGSRTATTQPSRWTP